MRTPIHTPYKNGKGGVQVGLEPISSSEWLEIDNLFLSEIQNKKNLFNTKHKQVYQDTPESINSQKEVLESILENLLLYHPKHYEKAKKNLTFRDNLTPLESAALLVQEDLLIMMPKDEEYFLSAASLCSPSNWSLREKFKKSLLDLHKDVPSYSDLIGERVNHLFTNLKNNRIFQRFNWSIYESPELYQPALNKASINRADNISETNAGDKLFIRVERQTIKKLNISKSILFTVRVHITPLVEIKNDLDLLKDLKKGIKNLTVPLKYYKSIDQIEEPLTSWLKAAISSLE